MIASLGLCCSKILSNALVSSKPQKNKPIEVKTIQYIQQLIYVYDQGVIQ